MRNHQLQATPVHIEGATRAQVFYHGVLTVTLQAMGVRGEALQVFVVPTIPYHTRVPALVGTNHPAVAALVPNLNSESD